MFCSVDYMEMRNDQLKALENFYYNSAFSEKGAVMTDLDGTAVHELDGRVIIHKNVEYGLKKIYESGLQVIINTLRFPLSVIRTFAKDWYKISSAPIAAILLNGSQLGYINRENSGFVFEQLASYPMTADEINTAVDTVDQIMTDDINDLILFSYFEDWRKGEIVWTPKQERIAHLQRKYPSATTVQSIPVNELRSRLVAEPVCMLLLLIDLPGDTLMAYQHTRRSNFITRQGVNKLFGAMKMAELLGIELRHSLGAGDSEMDTFLSCVGLSVHVNNPKLPFHGLAHTVRLNNFIEYGDLLFKLAELRAGLQNRI
jgi:hydroxymethylpyrimidine pyrophosphatase-like HAD family hydrolase